MHKIVVWESGTAMGLNMTKHQTNAKDSGACIKNC